jgi:hypothetical protein
LKIEFVVDRGGALSEIVRVSGHPKTGHSGVPQNQPTDWFEKGGIGFDDG